MIAEYGHPQLEELRLDQLLELWINIVTWGSIRPTFEEMVHADLTFPELIVLRMLRRAPLSVADVAMSISITQSAASRVVDRLVRDGYMERQENPADRRQKQLTLTPVGQSLMDQFEAKVARAAQPMVDALSTAEQKQFSGLLLKMVASQGPCPIPADSLQAYESAPA